MELSVFGRSQSRGWGPGFCSRVQFQTHSMTKLREFQIEIYSQESGRGGMLLFDGGFR